MVVYDARPSAFTQMTTTAEWEYFASAMAGISGIDVSVGSGMVPSLDTAGRNAVIADGNAIIKGQLWRCDAPVPTPVPAASSQNRIDRLVLRYTRGASTSATVVVPTVITGTPAGTPTPPAITQTPTGIWDVPVCRYTATSAGAISTLVDERIPINDPWHDMRPLLNGFVGSVAGEFPPQYRFDYQSGLVHVIGTLNLPSSGTYNGVSFAQLPPFYSPAVATSWAVAQTQGLMSTNNTGGMPRSYIASSGGLSFNGISPGINGSGVRINGFYPLQAFYNLLTA
jgi:hypothetical protein